MNKSEDQMLTVPLQQPVVCMGGAVGRENSHSPKEWQTRGRRSGERLLDLRVEENWILEVVKECQGAAEAVTAIHPL